MSSQEERSYSPEELENWRKHVKESLIDLFYRNWSFDWRGYNSGTLGDIIRMETPIFVDFVKDLKKKYGDNNIVFSGVTSTIRFPIYFISSGQVFKQYFLCYVSELVSNVFVGQKSLEDFLGLKAFFNTQKNYYELWFSREIEYSYKILLYGNGKEVEHPPSYYYTRQKAPYLTTERMSLVILSDGVENVKLLMSLVSISSTLNGDSYGWVFVIEAHAFKRDFAPYLKDFTIFEEFKKEMEDGFTDLPDVLRKEIEDSKEFEKRRLAEQKDFNPLDDFGLDSYPDETGDVDGSSSGRSAVLSALDSLELDESLSYVEDQPQDLLLAEPAFEPKVEEKVEPKVEPKMLSLKSEICEADKSAVFKSDPSISPQKKEERSKVLEMLELKKQISLLQARYDTLKGGSPSESTISASEATIEMEPDGPPSLLSKFKKAETPKLVNPSEDVAEKDLFETLYSQTGEDAFQCYRLMFRCYPSPLRGAGVRNIHRFQKNVFFRNRQ